MSNVSYELNNKVAKILNAMPGEQAIIVIGREGFKADLYLYEFFANENGGMWRIFRQMEANIGINGMGKANEGDLKSPNGIFSLGIAFGINPPPQGVKYPYKLLTSEYYWVDDVNSKDYNKLVHYRDGEVKDWQSAEHLWDEKICYRYAVVINYNTARELGKGSAIFLHVWKSENTPTQGCTTVSEVDMIQILQWLDPDKIPLFIQDSLDNILV